MRNYFALRLQETFPGIQERAQHSALEAKAGSCIRDDDVHRLGKVNVLRQVLEEIHFAVEAVVSAEFPRQLQGVAGFHGIDLAGTCLKNCAFPNLWTSSSLIQEPTLASRACWARSWNRFKSKIKIPAFSPIVDCTG